MHVRKSSGRIKSRVYHCWATTLPKLCLCGKKGKKDCDHRKEWIHERLVQMSEVFAVEVCGYAVNMDRLDVIIRIRPDVAKKWTKEEVVRRWKAIHPQDRERELEFQILKPSKQQIQEMLAEKKQVEECRKTALRRDGGSFETCARRSRAGSTARRAARVAFGTAGSARGRYSMRPRRWPVVWRSRSRRSSPEERRISPRAAYSSACDRIAGAKARARAKARAPRTKDPDALVCVRSTPTKPKGKAPAKSAFPMSPSDYVKLVEWTGKSIAAKKLDASPSADVAGALSKMGLDPDNWLDFVANLDARFTRAVGDPKLMAKEAKRIGKSWFRGHIHAAEAYQ